MPRLRLDIYGELAKGRVVLASQSPRRKDILEQNLEIDNISVQPSRFEENLDKDHMSPFEYVQETSARKALDVYRSEIDSDEPPSLVIAADTIVVAVETILEKPKNHAHQLQMLKSLRDSPFPHKVFTAVTCIAPLKIPIVPGYVLQTILEETEVQFDKDVSDELLEEYVASGEAEDAAGGYKIQGLGALLIQGIVGDYTNVVGLPARGTLKLIEHVVGLANNDED